MEKESSKEKNSKLDPQKKELILTIGVLIISIIVGIFIGIILYEAMYGPL